MACLRFKCMLIISFSSLFPILGFNFSDGDFEKVEDPSKEAEAVIEEPSPVPPCPNLTANPASPPRVPSYADDPFTLSQISPQKEQDPSHVSSSRSTRFPHPATRTATKRPASPTADTSSLAPQRKKGKEEPLLRAPITRARTRGLSKSGPSGVSSARSRPGPHEKQARLRQTPVGQASTSENLNGVPPPLPTAGLSSRNPGISVVRSTKRDGNQTAKAVGVGLGSSSTISKSLSSVRETFSPPLPPSPRLSFCACVIMPEGGTELKVLFAHLISNQFNYAI